jgi:hypothetical protein
MYKQILTAAGIGLLFASCSKNDNTSPQVSMAYLNLNNIVVTATTPLTIDLNNDGTVDFRVTTELSQDISSGSDLLEFRVTSLAQNQVLMKDDRTPARKEENVPIYITDELPYQWNTQLSAAIVTRVIPTDIANSHWQGTWLNHFNKYLPVKLVKDGASYLGWIQISFSNTVPMGIIVHDAAYNKIAGQPIKAGQK